MLTRNALLNGDFVDAHAHLVASKQCLSREQILDSMTISLKERPAGAPVWIFAYGSLMWNPLVTIEEMHRARLQGGSRWFCIRLISGRASPAQPGRMLALDKGSETEGMIFRLPEHCLEQELELIWTREMIGGLYIPVWADVLLSNGDTVKALVFVSDQGHPCYEADSTVSTVAKIVSRATGSIGSNASYVTQLDTTLSAWAIRDDYIQQIASILNNKYWDINEPPDAPADIY